jgi:hypothetical protein
MDRAAFFISCASNTEDLSHHHSVRQQHAATAATSHCRARPQLRPLTVSQNMTPNRRFENKLVGKFAQDILGDLSFLPGPLII